LLFWSAEDILGDRLCPLVGDLRSFVVTDSSKPAILP
jgi:hypothetical protein